MRIGGKWKIKHFLRLFNLSTIEQEDGYMFLLVSNTRGTIMTHPYTHTHIEAPPIGSRWRFLTLPNSLISQSQSICSIH